jgi:uncharacterized protein (TIGR03435 family)
MPLKSTIALLTLFLSAPLLAQSPAPAAQVTTPARPEFDVASVKQSPPGQRAMPTSNIPLTPGSTTQPIGGLFKAQNYPLMAYVMFAYNIPSDQLLSLTTSLPQWAFSDAFDIDARADGSPTRDQVREMMKSLLEDRFALKLHTVTADGPIFALVLAKSGKTGQHLQPHPADAPACPANAQDSPIPFATDKVAGGFPAQCGSVLLMPSSGFASLGVGGRNVSLDQIAEAISTFGSFLGNLSRPVRDQTGLTGKWDFVVNFAPQFPAGMPVPAGPQQQQPDADSAPTFLEALTDQLGLKLNNATGPVEKIVIDHVEKPMEN